MAKRRAALLPILLLVIVYSTNAENSEPPAVDYSCNTCGDCAVKNVGNCCGAYPKCVNRDFTPDYEGMQEWCKEQGVGGVCGFEDIDICTCQEGVCVGYASVNSPEIEQCQEPPSTTTAEEEDTTPNDTGMDEGPTDEEDTSPNDATVDEGPPVVDYSCDTCADCAIKNVGNCCGEYPKCVNRDFTPDYEGMQEWCKDQEMGGVCGFPSIDNCTCQDGVCVGYYSANSPEIEQCQDAPSSTTAEEEDGTGMDEGPTDEEDTSPNDANVADGPPAVDYSCNTCADCAIKNVGNCCGEYPKCVNRDFTPDYDGLQEWCKDQEMGGVCGFPSIDSCTCQDGVCVGYYSADSPEIEQCQDAPSTTTAEEEDGTGMDDGPNDEEDTSPEDATLDEDPPFVDYSCNTCGDCAVKNVGNCCGAYPKCVNRDFTPDYEGMQEWCKEQGVGGVCGFEDIDICTCEEGVCVGYASVNSPDKEQCQDPPSTTSNDSGNQQNANSLGNANTVFSTGIDDSVGASSAFSLGALGWIMALFTSLFYL